MKKLTQLIIIITAGLFLNSCYYDTYPGEGEGEGPGGPDPEPENVSYTNDIIPLWSQCVGCHKGTTPPDLRDDTSHSSYTSLLNGYVVPNDADSSVLYQSLINSNGVSLMPPGNKWPQAKIDLVKAWINQGALDN
jgi:hypothetical protein